MATNFLQDPWANMTRSQFYDQYGANSGASVPWITDPNRVVYEAHGDGGAQEPVSPWDGNQNIFGPGNLTPTDSSGNTGGGMDWGSLLQNIIGGGMNFAQNQGPLLSALYASQRGADEMNEQAGRYEALGERASGMADPWGSQRTKYQGKLDELLANPESSPIYQSLLREATNKFGPQAAARGQGGAMGVTADMTRLMGDVANKYTGEWADRYGRFGGSEINPGTAAQMLMEGGRQAGDARAQALAARLYPLGMLGGQGGSGGTGGGSGTPGSGGTGSNPINDLMKWIQQAIGGGANGQSGISPTNAASLLQMLGKGVGSLNGLWSDWNGNSPGLAEEYGITPGNAQNWTNWFSGYGSDFSPVNNLPIANNDIDWSNFNINDLNGLFDWGGSFDGSAIGDIMDWGG